MQTLALIAFAQAPQQAPEAPRTDDGSTIAVWIAVAIAVFAGRRSCHCPWQRKPEEPQPTA